MENPQPEPSRALLRRPSLHPCTSTPPCLRAAGETSHRRLPGESSRAAPDLLPSALLLSSLTSPSFPLRRELAAMPMVPEELASLPRDVTGS